MKESIVENGCRFEFFQAVRVLERLFPEREPVGGSSHPAREVARFGAHLSLGFPASQIQQVQVGEQEDAQPQVTVNFMGLTGPSGVLPQHYTEFLLERAYLKDRTLRDFLDLFNHRMISLFYRAWEKYRFPVAYERGNDAFTAYLSCMIGMGTPGLQRRLAFEDQSLLLYAGLFQQRPHSAVALESILRDFFELPVSARQFFGRWVRLGEENHTRLGVQNHRLGSNAILGSRVWDRQSKFRIRIGPMSCAAFESFLPGGSANEPLMQLSRLFAGYELDFDVQLIVAAAEVPACRLQSKGGARLGLSSWLKVREFAHDADDPVLACRN
jgi:type VI secretion system protein ImpH